MDFDAELDQFAHKFLGYGNFSAPLWFIGMEEGGGNSKEEIVLRLQAWKDLDKQNIVDVADFHERIGHRFLFQGKVKLQRTWSKLIAFQLSLLKLDCGREELRTFQRNKLGRSNSNNALLELMPLPSPGINKWFYNDYSGLPYLKTRENYLKEMVDKRISLIQKEIQKFKPKIVLFYGSGYDKYWKKIAGIEFKKELECEFLYGKKDNTLFIITKHPVSFIKTKYFENIGTLISKKYC